MANAAQAITELIENALSLGHKNEKVQDLHEERLQRLEAFFVGNGDSFPTRMRLLAQELDRLEERRETTIRSTEARLQQQLVALEERRDTAAHSLDERLQRQIDLLSTRVERADTRKWDLLKLAVGALLGAVLAYLVAVLKR